LFRELVNPRLPGQLKDAAKLHLVASLAFRYIHRVPSRRRHLSGPSGRAGSLGEAKLSSLEDKPVRSASDRRWPEHSPIVSIVRIVPARLWRLPQAIFGLRLSGNRSAPSPTAGMFSGA
jgi:hypothetical protein